MTIRVLDIIEETMADGPGLRTSIYCAGCLHHCPGCHNPQSWDMAGGKEMSVDKLLDLIKDDEFSNVTFTGGDPFYQVEAFTELARRIKEETGKTIWCYTGFTYEEIGIRSCFSGAAQTRGSSISTGRTRMSFQALSRQYLPDKPVLGCDMRPDVVQVAGAAPSPAEKHILERR